MKNLEKRISFGNVSVKGGKSGKYFALSVRIALYGKMSRPTFTAMASVGARFSGQCLDDVVCNDPLFVAIRRLWKAYHLNDMHAGTVEQEACLKAARNSGELIGSDLDDEVKCLKAKRLYIVKVDGKPYRYGSGWLYRSIPKEDIKIIRRILAAKGNTSEEIKSEFLAEVIH